MLIRVITLFLVLGWIAPPSLRAQSPQALTDALQSLADAVVKEIEQGGKRKIAVVPFHDLALQQESMFGRYVSEELVTRLFQTGNVDIVERQRLDALLEEAKLGTTGVVDPATAREIGKVAGVDALVTGTIADFQSFVAVNARLVDTETGQIFGAAQVKIVRDDDVKKILAMPLPEAGQSGPRVKPGNREIEESLVEPIQRTVVEGIAFELLGCRGTAAQIICDLRANNSGHDRDLVMDIGRSRAFDQQGSEHTIQQIEIANSSAGADHLTKQRLVHGVPTPMRVRIETARRVQRLSLLELQMGGGGGIRIERFRIGGSKSPSVVQFRNINVSY